MPVFQYIGRDNEGKPATGTVEAESAHQVSVILTERGIAVSSIQEQGKPAGFFRGRGLTAKDMAFLTEQLYTITKSGLPLSPALGTLLQDVRGRRLRKVVKDIQATLDGGGSLEDALSKHPGSFPAVYLSLIRAGERTGNLSGVLSQLCEYSSRMAEVKSGLQEIIAYPLFLIVALIILLTFVSVVVLPSFETIYSGFGKQLPWPTQACFSIGHGLQKAAMFFGNHGKPSELWIMRQLPVYADPHLMMVLAGIFGLWLLVRLLRPTQVGDALADWFKLRLPFFKTLYSASMVERFSRCLGMLLSNKAQAPESLILAAAAAGSPSFRGVGLKAALLVSHGEKVVDALASTRRFRHSYLWILGNAEEQGHLDSALLNLAESYEREVARRTRILLTMLGPALTIGLGLIIGFVAISMFMPILMLSSLVS